MFVSMVDMMVSVPALIVGSKGKSVKTLLHGVREFLGNDILALLPQGGRSIHPSDVWTGKEI